nr:GAF domain-containing protein [uncultured Faecalibaculum sp.]
MGKPACTSIPLGTGVVGTCARKQEALLVPDVHAFAGHIACDSDSRSEAVFPLMEDGTCIAVLDIDCLETDGISRREFESFRAIAGLLEPLLRQLQQQTLPFSA